MANTVDKVLNVAMGEVGYLEKRTNSSLDSKTANAGYNNFTKYWRDLYPAFQKQPWCLAFQDWIFKKAYGDTEAKKLLHAEKGYTYYCPTQVNQFKAHKQFYSYPVTGDLVFFKNSSGVACHVGIVYKVDSSKKIFYTIEGNTGAQSNTVIANGGGVFYKSYSMSNSRILGFGRPQYAVGASTVIKPIASATQSGFDKNAHSVDWVGVVTASSLNVRKGAGTANALISTYHAIYKNDIVGVCDSARDSKGALWYLVKIFGSVGDVYGYVSAQYIKKSTDHVYSSSIDGTYTVTASSLNLRETAGNGKIIDTINKGEKVDCKGIYTTVNSTKWYFVQSGKYTGYCSSQYLKRG